jgi:hypothetical protein
VTKSTQTTQIKLVKRHIDLYAFCSLSLSPDLAVVHLTGNKDETELLIHFWGEHSRQKSLFPPKKSVRF